MGSVCKRLLLKALISPPVNVMYGHKFGTSDICECTKNGDKAIISVIWNKDYIWESFTINPHVAMHLRDKYHTKGD